MIGLLLKPGPGSRFGNGFAKSSPTGKYSRSLTRWMHRETMRGEITKKKKARNNFVIGPKGKSKRIWGKKKKKRGATHKKTTVVLGISS